MAGEGQGEEGRTERKVMAEERETAIEDARGTSAWLVEHLLYLILEFSNFRCIEMIFYSQVDNMSGLLMN